MRVAPTARNGQKDRKSLYAGGFEQEYRYDASYDVAGSAHDHWRPLYTRLPIAGPSTPTIYEGNLSVVVEQLESTHPARMHCEAAQELSCEIQQEDMTGLMDDPL